MTAPRTLAQLRAIKDPAARALAAKAYIERSTQETREAREIQHEAVRIYAQDHSLSQTSAACGVSVTVVKQVKQ